VVTSAGREGASRRRRLERPGCRQLVRPPNQPSRSALGSALVTAGRTAEGLALCERLGTTLELSCIACAHHALGQAVQSKQALDALLIATGVRDQEFLVARAYACRGEADLALEWLEKARVKHLRAMAAVKGDPHFRTIRADPRYVELLRKLNLPVD
jgi:hypothetical protein